MEAVCYNREKKHFPPIFVYSKKRGKDFTMTYITNFIHNHKALCIAVGLLWLVGLFMLLFLTGHKFLGTALIGIGALMLFYTICPLLLHAFPIVKLLRTAVTVVLVICVAYFCVVESFII